MDFDADFDTHVTRINALTTNARNTWFVLLGVLVFVTITLMGVEDIDFYGVDRATKLPLVDVEVPTRLFFVAAPILSAAVYGYFHLYLIRLWDALGAAPAAHERRTLGDAVNPWLVTDMALFLRPKARVARAMDGPAFILNVGLAWVFGLAVLGWLWWESATGREVWMTMIACGALVVSLAAGYASARTMWIILRRNDHARHRATGGLGFLAAVWIGAPLLFIVSHSRAEQASDWVPLAPVQLAEARLVERPAGWLQYEHAKREFQVTWCKRESKDCAALSEEDEEAFAEEWQTRRGDQIGGLKRPGINGVSVTAFETAWRDEPSRTVEDLARFSERMSRSALNLTGADLRHAFLSGMNLTAARLGQANLNDANLEGADLPGAQLQDADLGWAQLQDANLSLAQLQGANLRGAQLQDANLREAQLQEADLWEAQLQDANLFRARLQEAYLSEAQLQDAFLHGAQLQDANLFEAQLQEANLHGAQLQEVFLIGAQLQGSTWPYAILTGTAANSILPLWTNLSASTNNGGALRFVDLSHARFDLRTDWRNVFLDGSVTGPSFKRIAGRGTPCQWVDRVITDDAAFMALWRWWFDIGPDGGGGLPTSLRMPSILREIDPASPALRAKYGIPDDCTWQTGPLRSFPGPHGP